MDNDAHGDSRQVAMVGCDEAQARAWGQKLRLMGCTPVSFDSSADFLRAATQGSHFDLLLVVLRDEGAWPVLTAMCKALRMPIFLVANAMQRELLAEVLSASGPESQGAGIDFAVLPVDDFEVELRVREALRRNEKLLHAPAVSATFGDYRFIGSRKVVVNKGEEVRLKPREFELALLLFRNADRLLEREWLLGSLWTESRIERKSRVLDCCVANVRRKLSLHKGNEFVLHSVYGRGYELRHVTARPIAGPVDDSGFPDTSNEPVWLREAARA
ncbi:MULTISPECIES: winged helix-turn-helix domain-containing protein [unclassified Variovorax]|jgi:DNA-binding response OmpR family regulator|uniref:response regulator transcription factor n=1 Tax=unclassified Variovorax TaxID=663243 RepID=UPI000F7E209B|nr:MULTISPECIES: winged helix-turn-helix domain-containing protein [unclassified Variovorax]RSZ47235.1 response regulator transcription factor [Variovorax sp. 553]RSZ48642.1 response regulator transcription factor [Variovorax sp. 679]